MSEIKVIIVDDHLVVREGLKQLIELDGDIKVVGQAENGFQCLKMVERLLPDIIFMDIHMPGMSGIDATRLVCRKYPQVKVLVLTIYDDDHYVEEAIDAGAMGYILKDVNREDLVNITRLAVAERAFLDPRITSTVLNRYKTKKKQHDKIQLTGRELEVLQGMVAGKIDRELAKDLCISEHTIRTHTKNLYRKLKVSSKSQAVAKALQNHIIN